MKTLKEMQDEVRVVNALNGWHDDARTFGDGMALLHSEVSEAFEAYRQWGLEDATSEHPALTEIDSVHVVVTPPKPEGVGSEFADILIRLLDEADRQDIDLDAEYARKIAYNRTRGHRHGGKRL